MKNIFVLLFFALSGGFATAQTSKPCDSEGHRQFHFWIGDKKVFLIEQPESSGTVLYGMTFTPMADGSVVQNWITTRDMETWTLSFYGIYRRKP